MIRNKGRSNAMVDIETHDVQIDKWVCTVDLLLFYRYDWDMSNTANREASKSSDTPKRSDSVDCIPVNHIDCRNSDKKSLFSAMKQKVRLFEFSIVGCWEMKEPKCFKRNPDLLVAKQRLHFGLSKVSVVVRNDLYCNIYIARVNCYFFSLIS